MQNSNKMDELELAPGFNIAVGDRVSIGTMKELIADRNIRILTPEDEKGTGSWNPMRRNIRLDANGVVEELTFG
jgi:hypothetical protein